MRSRVFPLASISMFTPICFIALQALHSAQAALASASQQLQSRVSLFKRVQPPKIYPSKTA